MFRFYFLTILTYIRIILRAVIWLLHLLLHAYCDWKQFALVRLSLEEATASIHHWVLWPKSFLIFIVWINWRTLQPTSFLSWCVSHVLGSVHRLVSHILEVVHWKKRLSLWMYWDKQCIQKKNIITFCILQKRYIRWAIRNGFIGVLHLFWFYWVSFVRVACSFCWSILILNN